jgi:hypothetical protein
MLMGFISQQTSLGGPSCMDCDNPQDIGEYTVESTRLLNTAQ